MHQRNIILVKETEGTDMLSSLSMAFGDNLTCLVQRKNGTIGNQGVISSSYSLYC